MKKQGEPAGNLIRKEDFSLLTCRPDKKAVESGALKAKVAIEVKAGEEILGGDNSSKEFSS